MKLSITRGTGKKAFVWQHNLQLRQGKLYVNRTQASFRQKQIPGLRCSKPALKLFLQYRVHLTTK